jgi:hypothetical protein
MLKLENFLAPSNVIGQGCDVPRLTELLTFAIGNKPGLHFNYMRPFPETDRSVRVLGKKPFEGGVSFPRPMSPEEMALSLMKYSDSRQPVDQARYSTQPSSSAIKGWMISRSADDLDEQGDPLVAAYATWID